jgi:tRNA pseudouridine13 synthase
VKPQGSIKAAPEDFVVDELPAYEPTGDGGHLYVRFRKTNLTTDAAVRAIADVAKVDRRDVGVAGLKDKVAVTTQWISVPASPGLEERIAAEAFPGIEILEQRRHGNKLRTGHLRGNAFRIVVRGIEPGAAPEVLRELDRISVDGVPNLFGAQRFGSEGDTHEQARAWLTGRARAPGNPRLRRFHFSAFQSWIFNQVLNRRVEDGTWNKPLLGDLLKKDETGGMFICTNVQEDRERAERGELCPTGPIVGDKMRQPEHDALELEQRIIAPCIEGIDLRRARSLGEGTRRPMRLRVTELTHRLLDGLDSSANDEMIRAQRAAIEVRFVLPRGAYATTVLSNALSIADAGRESPQAQELTEDE